MKTYRPLRNDIYCELIPANESLGSVYIPEVYRDRQHSCSKYRVLACGPDVHEEFGPGDIILVDGHRSGLRLDNDKYIVNLSIVLGYVTTTKEE